ncbi:N-acetylglucosamine-6-phosphate deacetylase [Francisella tularensis]|uniref:N-acetylglucosamine-6-phosphate deacetylase n=5 Tax=Francisella tularensis TaxID=263 RepID=A0AAI8FST6_FRATH|nr:N-acetylglucosamine-6-phosphate deacetylase [Francisella tularensis]AFX70475.1 N-acetylglucosamine-6-phosphate deacetylase [Francisella tularensis subsp. holarctica F92]EBA52392.1 N-acetylglucosamine-6-phosphate deacetylase [Francisella tularensis subsp. holarctica 257]ABI82716.1 glutaminase [Francisella tularensis subsp. holarctica OSU18]ABU61307.1 N-acetylglucosamine-6-phosphate deacetylase [Francisella tularensis subsp. holarctica FTNF002-00]AFT92642.1 N-acetylglucosamine-6-phosphate dea
MQSYILKGGKIYSQNDFEAKDIVVKDNVISDIVDDAKPAAFNLPIIELSGDDYVIPGFIDIHIHGSKGADVMDGDVDALAVISKSLYTQGVTSYLATTMTAANEQILKAMRAIKDYNSQTHLDSAKIVGVHLEGPFISPGKIGAQNPNYLQEADVTKMASWHNACDSLIKKITIAPEIKNANKVIEFCNSKNIISSIGHTSCTMAQALNAIEQGCTHATHLFNAMSPIEHRNPGAATALLMSKKVLAELIVDGIHLHPDMVKFTYAIKGSDKIALITDAMSAQSASEGVFELGGQKVIVKDGQARLENGVLAGSVLTMNKALENVLKFTNCSLYNAVKMTSTNQAKSLGFKKGQIKGGFDAEFVILNKNYQVKQVIG